MTTKALSKLLQACEIDMGTVCDMEECGSRASQIVVVHQFDHCHERNRRWQAGRGERVFLLCRPCAEMVMERIAKYINEMKHAVPQVKCEGCGLQVNWLSDLCRSMDFVP